MLDFVFMSSELNITGYNKKLFKKSKGFNGETITWL